MVRRGLVATRTEGLECIAAGRVLVSGAVAEKAARMVDAGEPVLVSGPPRRFVGRGGEKLEGALDAWGIDVQGVRALDVGASTGGFTDCLLQRGAATVVAVDVGRGQLDDRLRRDGRVESHERTDIRTLRLEAVGFDPFALVVVDVSFVSLRTVIGAILALAGPAADLIVLVKPQFEAGRREASRGKGVIRDPAVWRAVLLDVGSALETAGATMMGLMASPLRGGDGNVEFLARLIAHRSPPPTPLGLRLGVDALVASL